jgi:predicted nucleic acid-binding protein
VRGRRAVDLLVAATALAIDLPLYSANHADFAGLEVLIDLAAIKIDPPA